MGVYHPPSWLATDPEILAALDGAAPKVLVDRERTDDALGRHGASTDTGKRQRSVGGSAQGTHERRAKRIAGFLGGDQIYADDVSRCHLHMLIDLGKRLIGDHPPEALETVGEARELLPVGSIRKKKVSQPLKFEDYGDELKIPDKPFGFARLIRAQATGDFESLRERGRRIARVLMEDV